MNGDLELRQERRDVELAVYGEWDRDDELAVNLSNDSAYEKLTYWLTRAEAGQLRDHLDKMLRTSGIPRP